MHKRPSTSAKRSCAPFPRAGACLLHFESGMQKGCGLMIMHSRESEFFARPRDRLVFAKIQRRENTNVALVMTTCNPISTNYKRSVRHDEPLRTQARNPSVFNKQLQLLERRKQIAKFRWNNHRYVKYETRNWNARKKWAHVRKEKTCGIFG
jgi:hypothetical protein